MKIILKKIIYLDRKIEQSSSNVVFYSMKMGLLTFMVAVLAYFISLGGHYAIHGELWEHEPADYNVISFIIYGLIISPLVENFVLIMGIKAIDLFVNKVLISILIGISLICLLHTGETLYRFFYVLFLFVVIYFSYHRKRRISKFAFFRSVLIHACHNFYTLLFFGLFNLIEMGLIE